MHYWFSRPIKINKYHYQAFTRLLQRDETRAVSGTNTRATVLHRLVCDAELAQIVTNHLGLKK